MLIDSRRSRPLFWPTISLALPLILGLLAAHPARADDWALLIGIDQYADNNRINSLGGAAADARALAKTLRETAGLPDDHIQLLVSDGEAETRPTRVEILNALTRLAANAKAGDTVFVLYSGHGIEIDGTSYLLPYDTSALSDADIIDSALETEKFTKRLRLIKARALVLAFDMCRSDPRKGSRAIGADSDNKLSSAVVRGLDFAAVASTGNVPASASGPSIAITFYSCSPNERSYEDRLQARGYFSEYLEKGLRGAAADDSGTVRVAALAKYLEKSVHAAVAQAENGVSQTPYPEMKGPGVGDFVLAHRVVGTAVPEATVAALPPPVTHSDKMLLRYHARTGQTERSRATGSFTVAGGLGTIDTTEVDRVGFTNVDPETGEITVESTTEHMTATTSAGTQTSEAPETTTVTIRPNGKLESVKFVPESPGSDSGVARLRQATGIFFPDKPVGLGDKWSHDYASDPTIGTPAAHADFEIVSVTTINGAKRFKIAMNYLEAADTPISAQGTYVIDPLTGDALSGDVQLHGLPIAGYVVDGKMHSERIEGGASR